jgi:hypothetical protein
MSGTCSVDARMMASEQFDQGLKRVQEARRTANEKFDQAMDRIFETRSDALERADALVPDELREAFEGLQGPALQSLAIQGVEKARRAAGYEALMIGERSWREALDLEQDTKRESIEREVILALVSGDRERLEYWLDGLSEHFIYKIEMDVAPQAEQVLCAFVNALVSKAASGEGVTREISLDRSVGTLARITRLPSGSVQSQITRLQEKGFVIKAPGSDSRPQLYTISSLPLHAVLAMRCSSRAETRNHLYALLEQRAGHTPSNFDI